MNKKLVTLAICGVLAFGMVGCKEGEIVEETKQKVEQTEEQNKKAENKKEVKKEEKSDKITEKQEDKSKDVEGAYEFLKPVVEELGKGLNYDYEIIDGDIYLVGYISKAELAAALATDVWENNVEDLKQATEVISKNLRDNGYHQVKFNFSFCDADEGQNKCYLVVRDGRVLYNTAE